MLDAEDRARRITPGDSERLHEVTRAQVLCMQDDLDGAAARLEIDALPSPMRARSIRKRDRYEKALRRIIQEG